MRLMTILAGAAFALVGAAATPASAVPAPSADKIAAPQSAVQKVHWRGYRHCHRRYGYRRCHGPRVYGGWYGPGLYFNFGHNRRHYGWRGHRGGKWGNHRGHRGFGRHRGGRRH